MPRTRSPEYGAYSGIRNIVRTVMPPSVQHSQNRSSDRKYQDPQGSTSASPKPNADGTTPRVLYSQKAAAQDGSARPMTSASTAARQGTTPILQINGPPGLTQATSSASTSQSTTSRQPNGTDSSTERQTMRIRSAVNSIPCRVDTSPTRYHLNRNGSEANASHRQPGTSPTGYHLNRNGSEANASHRQPDTSSTGYQPNRNGSVANLIRRQLDTTYAPTENSMVKLDAAHRPRIHVEEAIEDALSRFDLLNQDETRFLNQKMQERAQVLCSLHEYLKFERSETCDAFNDLNVKLQNMAHERDEMQKRMKIMQDEVKKMQQELHHARSIEPDPVVVSISAFTPHTADGVSGRDLIQDMERLNDEIFQFAALLAEQFGKTTGRRRAALRHVPRSDVDMLHNLFGHNITTFVLQARDRQEHSWLMHAVQACVIESCKSVLASLLPFSKGSSNFEKMRRKIRNEEGQGMSGQWRSLVYRHGLDITQMEQEISNRITRNVWRLCSVLGWSAKDSTHLESLKSIASRTLQLHRTIYLEILSGDITIISPELGTPFDPETMEVSEVRSADAKLQPVLCTTDMGLRKSAVEKVFSNGKYELKEDKTIILKARVFLDPSVADDDSSWSDISRNNSRSS